MIDMETGSVFVGIKHKDCFVIRSPTPFFAIVISGKSPLTAPLILRPSKEIFTSSFDQRKVMNFYTMPVQ